MPEFQKLYNRCHSFCIKGIQVVMKVIRNSGIEIKIKCKIIGISYYKIINA